MDTNETKEVVIKDGSGNVLLSVEVKPKTNPTDKPAARDKGVFDWTERTPISVTNDPTFQAELRKRGFTSLNEETKEILKSIQEAEKLWEKKSKEFREMMNSVFISAVGGRPQIVLPNGETYGNAKSHLETLLMEEIKALFTT